MGSPAIMPLAGSLRRVNMLEMKRLHLARLEVAGEQWPVHGFVVTHPGGALLVDTGVGGPDELLDDWRGVNRTAADPLARIAMSPADIHLVINTPLHFDHCGPNPGLSPSPSYLPPRQVETAQGDAPL